MTITVQMRTEISQLYVALFGRAPDGEGLGFWVSLRDQGQSLAQIANTMYATTPARAIYPSFMTNGEIIGSFYTNVLGRTADAEGLAFWTGKLNAAGATPGSVISELINTVATYKGTDAAGVTSAALFNNRVTVAQYYGEKNGNIAGASTVLATVTADAASVTTAKASIDGTVTTGSTFTLTSGIETITGTAGNDTIIGDSNTTSAADQISGGAGTDTLKLYSVATGTTFPQVSNVENIYLNATTGGLNVSTLAGVTSLEADSVATGQTFTVTTGQAVKLTNIAAGTTTSVAGNTPTSLDLTLNKVGSATATANVDLTGTAVASAKVTATGSNSNIVLQNTGAKLATLTTAGDKVLKVSSALTTLTTIDATASTGGINVDAVGASSLTFTGSGAADRINMVATLTAADKLDGGAGTDTLAFGTGGGATLTTAAAANVKGFEILEASGAASGTYDVDALIANNPLTGIVVSATTSATVNNINSGAVGNITINADGVGTLAFTGKDFVAGGTSDTATINLDNSVTKATDGVDVTTSLTFTNVDIANIVSKGDGTAAKTIASGNGNSIASLVGTDLDKISISGDESVTLATGAGTLASEIDASALTGKAAVSVDTSGAAVVTELIKATANADTINTNNAATLTTTLFTGGGSDTLTLNGKATSVNTLKFTTTALNAGDLKAGDATTIALGSTPAAGGKVILDFGSTLEGLLKVGGVNLGTTVSDVTVKAATLGATTNVAASIATVGGNDVMTVNFDLNGDGVYTAASDAQFAITITGVATTNSTFNYDATNKYFVLTIV